jgi:hypothetical protein
MAAKGMIEVRLAKGGVAGHAQDHLRIRMLAVVRGNSRFMEISYRSEVSESVRHDREDDEHGNDEVRLLQFASDVLQVSIERAQ